MQNLFYVPPYLGDDLHPKPLGVRTVVKRNQPTRLDFAQPSLGYPHLFVPTPTKPAKPRKLTAPLGRFLIRLGRRLAPDDAPENQRGDPLPQGQLG